jgi:hypothetical protein
LKVGAMAVAWSQVGGGNGSLANKMARIAFAILRGKTVYREFPA